VSQVEHHVRPLLHLERRVLDPAVAVRHGLVVALALALGFAFDEPKLGFTAAMGALQLGFYDNREPYLARLETMAAVTLALAVAAVIGTQARHTPTVTVVTVGVAFVGGLMTAIGPNAALAGLHSTVLVLVFSSVSGIGALVVGGGVLLGGAVQALVSLVGWPVHPYRPEERALVAAWEALADFGRHGDDERDRAAMVALSDAGTTLALSSARGAAGQRLRGLLDRGDGLRLELVALGRRAGEGAARLREMTGAAVTGLAEALVGPSADRAARAEMALDRFRAAVAGTPAEAALPPVRLTAVERELYETAALMDPGWQADARTPPLRRRHGPSDGWRALRAAATPGSALFRHAARLALAVLIADLVAGGFGLSRGYWVAMTVAVVLRPDYSSTLQRGVGRVAGTLAGVLLAWGCVSLVGSDRGWLVVLVGAFACATFLLMKANFVLGAASLTALISCLLEVEGQPLSQTAPARLVDTVIGGAIAVAVYLLWPTWQGSDLAEVAAQSVDASRAWASSIFGALAERGTYTAATIRELGSRARETRAEAEMAVDGAQGEPHRGQVPLATVAAVVAANRRLNRALVSLEVVAKAPTQDRPRLLVAGAELDRALAAVAARLRATTGVLSPTGYDAVVRVDQAARDDPITVEVGRALDAASGLLDLTR